MNKILFPSSRNSYSRKQVPVFSMLNCEASLEWFNLNSITNKLRRTQKALLVQQKWYSKEHRQTGPREHIDLWWKFRILAWPLVDMMYLSISNSGRPGWYILQLQAAQLKWDLEDSKLILFWCTKISLTFFHLTLLDHSEVIAKWNT